MKPLHLLGSCVAVYGGTERFNKKDFHLCAEDEQKSYGFEKT